MPPMAMPPPLPPEVSATAVWATAARTVTAPVTTTWRGLAGELVPAVGPMRASVPTPPASETPAVRTSTLTSVVAVATTVSEAADTPVLEPTDAVVDALWEADAINTTVVTPPPAPPRAVPLVLVVDVAVTLTAPVAVTTTLSPITACTKPTSEASPRPPAPPTSETPATSISPRVVSVWPDRPVRAAVTATEAAVTSASGAMTAPVVTVVLATAIIDEIVTPPPSPPSVWARERLEVWALTVRAPPATIVVPIPTSAPVEPPRLELALVVLTLAT